MTATLSRGQEAARADYSVQRLSDPDQIRALLEPERAYAAYALAQLEPKRFHLSEWYEASGATGPGGSGVEGKALVVHSASGLGRALFALGDAQALDAILSLHPGPRFSFASLRTEHRPIVERYFVMTRQQLMVRMAVTTQSFVATTGPAVRLTGRDVATVNRLYSTEGVPAGYRPSHMEDGVYYGVYADGRLVSIAGTHVVSAAEGVAVVGNVFTHPRYRRRGLATIATSAATGDLLQSCPLVVLTVETENHPAIAIYKRLGYTPHCTLHETPLIRKEPIGVLSLARRLVAGWRGRAEGKEVVEL